MLARHPDSPDDLLPLHATPSSLALRKAHGVVAIVALLALLGLFWKLGGYPLLEPDEGRNVQVAREMVRGGDWVLPHLSALPYLDKPQPYFAAVALALAAFGESEAAARAASLAFVLGAILLVWHLGRRLGPPGTGEIAALALATMPLTAVYARTVIPDPAVLFLATAALVAAWRGFEDRARGTRWFALAWAVLGLALITKGPAAFVVPLLVVIAWTFAADLPLRRFFAWRAWPWMFVTSLPWVVAVSLRRPDFLHYVLFEETLGRLASNVHGRTRPMAFFVPVVLGGAFPWIVPALAALREAVRRRGARRSPAGRAAAFALAWALVPIVFFSLPRSKLPGYVLPAMPGIALAAGLLFAHAMTSRAWSAVARRALAVAGVVTLVLAVLLLASPSLDRAMAPLSPPIRAAFPPFAVAFGILLALAAAAMAWSAWRARLSIGVAALALPVAALPFLFMPLLDVVAHDHSSIDLAQEIERAAPGARVVGVSIYPTSLRYYLDRPVLVTSRDGRELTSNYVASRYAELKEAPSTPLRDWYWWYFALERCEEPTVFVVEADRAEVQYLADRLPRIASGSGGRVLAFGPCRPAGTTEQP